MAPVQLKDPIARATPFRLFVSILLLAQITSQLTADVSAAWLWRGLSLLVWIGVCWLARRVDTPPVAMLLHSVEAAWLPVLVSTMPATVVLHVLLIALAGAAASGGWRFLLPALGIMTGTGLLVLQQWQLPVFDSLLMAGFLLPLALVSFTQAQRLHGRGHAARSRSAALSRANAHLEKYLPDVVVQRTRQGRMARQAPHTRWLSVVFVDLVGFSGYARGRPEAEIVAVIDDYQSALSTRVAVHRGVLGKFLGDGALIYFLADSTGSANDQAGSVPPADQRVRQAHSALMLAAQLPELLAGLNHRWQRQGYITRLQLRSGIASGFCALGDWGGVEAGRLDHCVIGDPVNLASRLQSAAEPGGTLVCPVTAALLDAEDQRTVEAGPWLGKGVQLELKGLGASLAFPLVDSAIGHL